MSGCLIRRAGRCDKAQILGPIAIRPCLRHFRDRRERSDAESTDRGPANVVDGRVQHALVGRQELQRTDAAASPRNRDEVARLDLRVHEFSDRAADGVG